MNYKKRSLEDITKVIDPIVAMRTKQWFLATAEKNGVPATLTCAWGSVGNVWEKKIFTIFIRPQRNTLPYILESGKFTATFFDGREKELTFLGRTSGKEVPDKIEKSGLNIDYIDGLPTFKEGKYVITCKVIYVKQLEKNAFIDKEIAEKCYFKGDFSYEIVGEIENFYEIE